MGQKINIAIIAGQLVVGGAEWQLYLWLANLDRERFEPVVLTLHSGHGDYWETPIEALGIPLHKIAHRSSQILRLFEIIKVLRPYKPKLIHGWHLFASVYAGLAAKILGAKSLAGVRNTFQTFNSHSLEAKLALYTVDVIVANSEATAEQLTEMRKPRKQMVFAVQNAIENQFIDRMEMRNRLVHEYELPADAIWIGSMGRLDPLKRFDLLIKIMQTLKDEVENIHFLLIGDGSERENLERLVKEHELSDQITFSGEVPLASTWLRALDIFCFASVDEGLPNVIMEAAAAGLPIVTWRLPFNEELLEDGKTALLVEAEDINGFKEAIVKLIQSPAHRATLGEAARKHILVNFGLERYVKNMTHVYETILGIQENVNGGQT